MGEEQRRLYEKQLARQAEWRRRDRVRTPEKYKAANRRYYETNKERLSRLNREAKQRMKRDRNEHYLLKAREWNHKRHARKKVVQVEKVDFARVLARHGRICHICGDPISEKPTTRAERLSFDHIVPLSRGGPHAESNLAPAHFGCNSGKHARLDYSPPSRVSV